MFKVCSIQYSRFKIQDLLICTPNSLFPPPYPEVSGGAEKSIFRVVLEIGAWCLDFFTLHFPLPTFHYSVLSVKNSTYAKA